MYAGPCSSKTSRHKGLTAVILVVLGSKPRAFGQFSGWQDKTLSPKSSKEAPRLLSCQPEATTEDPSSLRVADKSYKQALKGRREPE